MRFNSRFWYLLSILFFVAAVWFWLKGDEERARRQAGRGSAAAQKAGPLANRLVQAPASGTNASPVKSGSVSGGNQATGGVETKPSASGPQGRFPYRLSNTEQPLSKLGRSDTAILLDNAFIETASQRPVEVPEHLRAKGDPGSYLVQSRHALDNAFYGSLREAGAEFVSYIPNNAALVRVSAAGASQLAGLSGVQAVLAYEPYYKLAQPLLALAVEKQSVPPNSPLNVTLFAGAKEEVSGALRDLGAAVIGEERTPFGPLLRIEAAPDSLAELAQLRGVQRIEYARGRGWLNDRSRVRLQVSADTVAPTNYLDLTGTNVMLNINDSGVDATNVGLVGRVFTTDTNTFTLVDVEGHGTHVAGTLIGNGVRSDTARDSTSKPPSGSVTNADFRGMAPAASLFVLPIDLRIGPLISDTYLQETAASNNFIVLGRTNAVISNNSWSYVNAFEYDVASASYDAAVRDALPERPGSQPILYVFAAGNSGFGSTNGTVGEPDSILAPATAKNVITVGAIESSRNITNEAVINGETNQLFVGFTDSDNEVASFSSRGNVGIGTEGDFGRFKPDVVAPGTFVVSTRSQNMDPNNLNPFVPDLGPNYRYDTGTSMAAPSVSGVLALMQEFFEQKLQRGFSPALMKALLINGARSVNANYDLSVSNAINFQGWGLVNLTNSLPAALTNATGETSWPVRFFDQSPTNGLATGQRHTWNLALSSDARFVPLRVTLVWTDPPGNPGAGIKLVNDLDLIVTNLDSGQVFLGNNISAGADFNQPGDTNALADFVNNVENVFLQPALGTNYSITVAGRRVNVNAVTANTNDVVQDYALVVACGNGEVAGAIDSLTRAGDGVIPRPGLIGLTNGVPLLKQRVGANFQLAPSADGETNQWRFYAFTNAFFTNNLSGLTNGSNVAFITFLPPDLARPRNLDADIDLYVSTNAALIELDAAVIANAYKSTNRGGNEVILFTNAAVGLDQIYYIGVKSEDQQGAEFGIVGLSTDVPFSAEDPNGNRTLRGMPFSVEIPDGTPDAPGAALMFAVDPLPPVAIGSVTVNLNLTHQSIGDLFGNLSHGDRFAVLNNHTRFEGTTNTVFQLRYDDSGNGQLLLSRPTDGPGSLNNFVGGTTAGAWLLTMSDNAHSGTGRVDGLSIHVQPERLLSGVGVDVSVLANQWLYFPIEVPLDATKLTVFLSAVSAPLNLYIKRDQPPTTTDYDKFALINPPGGSLSIGLGDVPPLNGGRYFIGVFNPNAFTVNFHIAASIDENPAALLSQAYQPTNSPGLPDDAIMDSSIVVTNNRSVADVQVGVRIDHARASDLVLHLVSPQGTRILLAENRGRDNILGYGLGSGSSTNVTNVVATVMQDGFENASDALNVPAGSYVDGWHVDQDNIDVLGPGNYPSLGPAHSGVNWIDIQGNTFGIISTNINTTPGKLYRLSFAYTRNDDSLNPGPASANIKVNGNLLLNVFAPVDNSIGNPNWKTTSAVFTASSALTKLEVASATVSHPFAGVFFDTFKVEELSVTTPLLYTIFTEDTNLTTMPVKFGIPPFASTNGFSRNLVYTNSFEGTNVGDYCAVTNFGAWQLYSNHVTVVSNVLQSHTGANYLELVNGQALLTLPTTAGGQYQLTHVFRRDPPDPSLVSWWPGEGDARDIVGTNNGVATGVTFTNGEVGQAFNFDGTNSQITIPPATNLNVTSFTIDAWIYPTDLYSDRPLVEYSDVSGNSGVNFWLNHDVTGATVPGQLYANIRDNTSFTPHEIVSFPGNIRSNEWQHVALTYDQSSGVARLYANGLLMAVRNLGSYIPKTDFPLNIGYRSPSISDPASGHHFAGQLDEVDVWSRALSPTEIRAIYLAGSDGKCGAQTLKFPTPISWWPAEGNANDISDGNSGSLTNGAAFVGGVVGRAFRFDGRNGSGVLLGNPTNLQLQDFSIEGWIQRANTNKISLDPLNSGGEILCYGTWGYAFGLVDNGQLFLSQVDISDVRSTNRITDTGFHHVAVTKTGGNVVFYVDGAVAGVATNYNPVFQFTSNVGLGVRGDNLGGSFLGSLDEVAIYDHALDSCDIRDIFEANVKGKYSLLGRPAPCLVTADVIVDDRVTNTIGSLDWRSWQTNIIRFGATQKGTPLRLVGHEPEMQFDTFELSELTSGNYYLPEETLKRLIGESALGTWRLEVWDNRVGAFINPSPELLSWQLRFIFANTNAPAIPLTFVPATTNVASVYDTNGVAVTNIVAGGQIRYFIVDVPRRATLATNVLAGTGDLKLLFDQDALPTGTLPGDVVFNNNGAGGGETFLLATNGLPPNLKPGQRYYLGVGNVNPGETNTFTISVAFDRTDTNLISVLELTNAICYTSTIPVTNAIDYYQFNVSTNATAVSFELSPQNGNVDLVVRRALPVPDPLPRPMAGKYDYLSANPNTTAEQILVTGSSSPVALAPGIWYLGVYNLDTNAVTYTVCATESTNSPYNIIRLTNNVPLDFTIAFGSQPTNFFLFTVDQTNAAVQFDLYNLNNPADLLIQRGRLPTPSDYFDGGSGDSAYPVSITVVTNDLFPDLNGDWYLAVNNNGPGDLTFTIRASLAGSGGVIINPQLIITNGTICLSWNSIVGVNYYVESKTNLTDPTWTVISPTITASDSTTTFCVPITGNQQFFRVVEGTAPSSAAINFSSLTMTAGGFVLNWTAAVGDRFQVQYTTNVPPVWITFTNQVTSATGNFAFTDDGSQSGGLSALRFYRLMRLP